MSSRHLRQMRVPDVGHEGQRAIAEATATVPGDDLASEVALRYLAGAGVGTLVVANERLATLGRAIDQRLIFHIDASLATAPIADAEAAASRVTAGPVSVGCAFALRFLAEVVVGRCRPANLPVPETPETQPGPP
jgi:hypothetical protein